jgi:O-antigen ligase
MDRESDDRLLTFGFAALTAAAFFGFAIVSLMPVALGVPSRPISTAYRIAVVLGSIVYVCWSAALRIDTLPKRVLWPVGLLAAMLLVRMLWDSLATGLPLDLPWDDYWLQVIAVEVLPALPFLFVPRATGLKLARQLCVAAGIIAVLAIAAGAYLSLRHMTSSSRLTTDVLNPIGIGEVGVSLYIVCLAAYPANAGLARKWLRILLRVGGGIMGAVLCVVSASKGPLLSLAAVTILMFGFRAARLPPARRRVELVLACIMLAGIVSLGVVLEQHGLLAIYNRFSDIASDRSTAIRVQAWFGAATQFDSSPLLGNSFVELSTRFYPHNSVLETMMATGVFGYALLLLVLALCSAAALGLMLHARELSWVALLFLQHAISGMLSGSIYRTGGYWISLLMVIGAFLMIHRSPAATMPRPLESVP